MDPTQAGHTRTTPFGDYVVAAAGNGRVFGVVFGDGTLRIFDSLTPDAEPISVQAHAGAGLCITADIDNRAFLTGGDDGSLVRTDVLGNRATLAEHQHRWVEHVAVHSGTGQRIYAVGKDTYMIPKKEDAEPRKFSHKSTIGGLAINPKGRRLAVSHYDGVSLWWLAAKNSNPTLLEWKGSHLQLAWSPNGAYVMSAMQENAVHGWRLSDNEHMRMSGYGAKIRSLAFTRKGHFLATGGGDSVVCWPFTGGGPMGKLPVQFGGGDGIAVTAVAANPKLDLIAAGLESGKVILGQPGQDRPVAIIDGKHDPVTTMCWNSNGDVLLVGTEGGDIYISDFRD